MKICVAQVKSIKGDIQGNIQHHKYFIRLASEHKADLVMFPELSLTNYEPTLAQALATDKDDQRLDDFQTISNDDNITIGVGIPTRTNAGIHISMILFQPGKTREVYSKKYLHADEEPFFVSGENLESLQIGTTKISLAICYEISIAAHAENAYRQRADIYIASVAKTADGVSKAIDTLSATAKKYNMTVMMSNAIGHADNFISAGRTSAWNKKGELLAQLHDKTEGVIIFDTETQQVISI